jgi:hypothetical protein
MKPGARLLEAAETAQSPGQKRIYCSVFRDYRARTAWIAFLAAHGVRDAGRRIALAADWNFRKSVVLALDRDE